MNSTHIARLCAAFGLGAPVTKPQSVPGGLLHHVWHLRTAQGDFAVKELNPEITRRPGIREAYRCTERIAAAMASAGVPAIAALDAEGEPARDVGGATVLVYPWVEGATLPPVGASPARARQVGAVLARMHALRLELPGVEPQAALWGLARDDDWLLLVRRAAAAGVAWADAVRAALPEIAAWNATYRQALPVLARTLVISHRDLDPKNVLWRDGRTPLIVDWESAGPINPAVELAGVALNWSGHETGLPDAATFAAALDGYRGAGGSVHEAGSVALAGCMGSWLDWLQFSMRRSLGEQDAGPGERELGNRETVASLAALRTLAANLETWGRWIDGYAEQEGA